MCICLFVFHIYLYIYINLYIHFFDTQLITWDVVIQQIPSTWWKVHLGDIKLLILENLANQKVHETNSSKVEKTGGHCWCLCISLWKKRGELWWFLFSGTDALASFLLQLRWVLRLKNFTFCSVNGTICGGKPEVSVSGMQKITVGLKTIIRLGFGEGEISPQQ